MLSCGYDCYKIGGPYIAENPACPKHGHKVESKEDQVRDILTRIWYREISAADGYEELEALF